MLPLSTLYRKVTSVSDLLSSSDMRFNWIYFVGAAFCLAALKWKSYLPHIKNNHLRWTSTGKQRNWALDLITILTLILVYGITRVGERINRVLLTFKGANHIRGGFLRESDPLSYCSKKPHVISGGGGHTPLLPPRSTPAHDPSKISSVSALIWFVTSTKCLSM